jgi:hypothetical protein
LPTALAALMNPEERARQSIDRPLTAAGWAVQDYEAADLTAARGVALREFELNLGHGTADYLLYVDGKAAGIVEAKKQGATLTGVEVQSGKYAQGLPPIRQQVPRARIEPTLGSFGEAANATPACPICKAPMQLRKAGRGANAGQAFWGCSRFPACRGTRAQAVAGNA